jgi:hypothetical protein
MARSQLASGDGGTVMTGVTAMGVQGGEIAMQHQGFLL